MHSRTLLSCAVALALLAISLGLCSCAVIEDPVEPAPTAEQKTELASRFYALLTEKCWHCHGEPGQPVHGLDGTLDFILDYDKLVESKLLEPGNLSSRLFRQVEAGSMPMEYDPDTRKMYEKKLPPEGIDLMLRWMRAGSPRWDANARVETKPAKFAWSELKTSAPTARAAMAMAEGPGGSILMFGGADKEGPLTDTWIFSAGAWKQARPATPPRATGAYAMAFDEKRGVSVLVGLDMSIHEWDGSDWSQVKTPASPPVRSEFSLAYDPGLGAMLLFGGLDYATGDDLSDLWAYDGATWKKLESKDGPMARHGAVLAWSPANSALLLFGGKNFYGRYADTWLFDGRVWKAQAPADSPPVCENLLIASGGFGPVLVCSAPADDTSLVWQWSGKNWLRGPDLPKSRAQGGIAQDRAGKAIVVFGGAFGTGLLADTWKLVELK